MESSTVSSRFLFRDHLQAENATESDNSSVISSISSDADENSELESMAGTGIRRLCTELLEIKAISDEDFHTNVFANYTTFIGILEEVNDMEKELMQLRTHVLTHKRLVQDVLPGVYLKALSDETMENIIEELKSDESPPLNELEVHIDYVSEALDMLLSENRVDEAIAILEMEEENLQRLQLEDDTPLDLLMLYNSTISEKKAVITSQLTLEAENCRISAAELQKALVGICRLGDGHLATQILIKYYRSRLATGIHNVLTSKSFLDSVYIMELSKLVFSTISQAARSFVMLYGETSPYASEFIQWIQEEIESFAVSFSKYVKSISEISGGLSAAVEAVQFAISYCSLLETQRLVLNRCLIKHLQSCMEDVLQIHIDHFKKVIYIFTATDAWVLGRYLVSGILNEGSSCVVIGQQPEYCLLTNSGRKFVTLLQAITKDVTPLAALQMEGSILAGLSNLFLEYIAILEKALTSEINVSRGNGSTIILAESMPQQVSILANVSTLEHFFSSTVVTIFRGINTINSELTEDPSVDIQQHEIDNYVMVIQEASGHLRAQFFRQFLYRVFSLEKCNITSLICGNSETGSSPVHDPMPSAVFQLLFLELRKLGKLAEDNVFEADWLMDLLRELIEAIFSWISNNKEIWETKKGKLNFQNAEVLNQFVLDINFLVEVIRYGEYFPEQPLAPANLMQSVFISAGLDPLRDDDDNGWAIKAASDAIERLIEIEKTESLSNHEEAVNDSVEPAVNNSENGSETFLDAVDARSSVDVSSVTEEDEATIEDSEVAMKQGKETRTTELIHHIRSSDSAKDLGYSVSGEYLE
ncbi:exocyst complex component EXO84C-like [Euphorbia lathyris]|uniref:exocyst complex component EXO84C-like n=1 Tax=Euphorbia lathyris TaxID=212925 RepID=UPI003313DDE7